MVAARYVPEAGDLIWLNFDPQAGHEQAGHRPAVVLSPATYNGKTGLAVVCPVTSRSKGYPFEVPLPADCSVEGFVLSDQVRSLDWKIRRARHEARLPSSVLEAVRDNVSLLIGRTGPS